MCRERDSQRQERSCSQALPRCAAASSRGGPRASRRHCPPACRARHTHDHRQDAAVPASRASDRPSEPCPSMLGAAASHTHPVPFRRRRRGAVRPAAGTLARTSPVCGFGSGLGCPLPLRRLNRPPASDPIKLGAAADGLKLSRRPPARVLQRPPGHRAPRPPPPRPARLLCTSPPPAPFPLASIVVCAGLPRPFPSPPRRSSPPWPPRPPSASRPGTSLCTHWRRERRDSRCTLLSGRWAKPRAVLRRYARSSPLPAPCYPVSRSSLVRLSFVSVRRN